MGNSKDWLKASQRHQYILQKFKKLLGGGLIAALIVGPLIYFSVWAQRTGEPLVVSGPAQVRFAAETRPDSETHEQISEKPLKFPAKKEIDITNKNLELEINKTKLSEQAITPDDTGITFEEELTGELKDNLAQEFDADIQQINIRSIKREVENIPEEILVLDKVRIESTQTEIKSTDDADIAVRNATRKYLQSLPEGKGEGFAILKDTSKLETSAKSKNLVLSKLQNHSGKWYATMQQYNDGLPVFDGSLKLIFTEQKKLLAITDNIKYELPTATELSVGTALAEETTKSVFEWDDEVYKVEFVEKGYDQNNLVYKIDVESQINGAKFEVFVDGKDAKVNKISNDIRLQDTEFAATPEITELPAEGDLAATREITEEPQMVEIPPEILISETGTTEEPEIIILDALFGQILGTIYPRTPTDELDTAPLAHGYTYINEQQYVTDQGGYFENKNQEWYSTFLDGPYVTVYDDDSTADAEFVDNTPEDPFTWDESRASLAAINAFYHTNIMRDYFLDNLGFEITGKVPLTVNSSLVDAYLDGCGAWYNSTDKTIEMGRGGTISCRDELNYALSSDFVYHEYTHYVVESVTHLPNIQGAESAAMSEGLADYFPASINNDSVWGDVVSPTRSRNLANNLNYTTDMIGESHYDGQIFAGALWDLREMIGQETVDRLVFDTLYQDRLHFETFMYGMIIEDDDDGDFSNGTPHLIEIITAFENHGIGPGVANFNGLPISPEAWSELLAEEAPEGEEDPLMGGTSGSCGTSPTVNIIVPAGGTCTVTSSHTTSGYVSVADTGYLYVDAPLTVGTYMLVSGTVQFRNNYTTSISQHIRTNGGGIIYIISGHDVTAASMHAYGIFNIGWYTDGNDDGSLRVTGNGTVYTGGGSVRVRTYDYASYALFRVDGTLTVYGDSAAPFWPVTIQVDRYAALWAATLTASGSSAGDAIINVQGDINSYNTSNDINVNGYSTTNQANINIASTGRVYAEHLTFRSAGSYGGIITNDNQLNADIININYAGILTNNSELNVDYDSGVINSGIMTINNGGSFENNDSGGTPDCNIDVGLNINSGGTFTNNNTTSEDMVIAGDVNMTGSNAVWNNNGWARLAGTLTMQTNNPTITNSGSSAILRVQNGSGTTSNDIVMYNDAKIVNQSSAQILVYDQVLMGHSDAGSTYDGETPTVENSANFFIGHTNSTQFGTTGNALFIRKNAYFWNKAGGVLRVDHASTSTDDGRIVISTTNSNTGNTPVFDNYGSVYAAQMQVGSDSPLANYDAVYNNKSGATTDLMYSGVSFNTLAIYARGTVNIDSGTTLFDVDGKTDMLGESSSTYRALLNNDADSLTMDGNVTVGDWAQIDNSGTCDTGSVYLDSLNGYGLTTLLNTGQFTVKDYLTLNNGAYINNENSTNTGNIDVYDGVTVNGSSFIYITNGTFEVDPGIYPNAYVTLNDTSRIYVTDQQGSAVNTILRIHGTLNIFEGSFVLNNNHPTITTYDQAEIEVNFLKVGNYSLSTDGGALINNTEGFVDVLDSGTEAMEIYIGTVTNQTTANDFEVAGTLTMRGTDYSDNAGLFNNYMPNTTNNMTIGGDLVINQYGDFRNFGGGSTTVELDILGGLDINSGRFRAEQGTLLDVAGDVSVGGTSGDDELGKFSTTYANVDVEVAGSFTVSTHGLATFISGSDLWVQGSVIASGLSARFQTYTTINRDDGLHTQYGTLMSNDGGDVDFYSGSSLSRFNSIYMTSPNGAPTITVAAGVTVYLNGTHTNISGTGICETANCSIELASFHGSGADMNLNIYGEIEVADTAFDANILLENTITGNAYINIYENGILDVNETAGTFYINEDGKLNVLGTVTNPNAIADIEMDTNVGTNGYIQTGYVLYPGPVANNPGKVDINANLTISGTVAVLNSSAYLDVSGIIGINNGGILDNMDGYVNYNYQTANINVYVGGTMRGDNDPNTINSYFYFGQLDNNGGTVSFKRHADGITVYNRGGGTMTFGSDSYGGSSPSYNVGRPGYPGVMWSSNGSSVLDIYGNITFDTTPGAAALSANTGGTINIKDSTVASVYSLIDIDGGGIQARSSGTLNIEGRIINGGNLYMDEQGAINIYNPDGVSIGYTNDVATIQMLTPTSGFIPSTSITIHSGSLYVTGSRTCGSSTCSMEIGNNTVTDPLASAGISVYGTLRVQNTTNADVILGKTYGALAVQSGGTINIEEDNGSTRIRNSGRIMLHGGTFISQMPLLVLDDGQAQVSGSGIMSLYYCALIDDNGQMVADAGSTLWINQNQVACPLIEEGANSTDGLHINSGITADGEFNTVTSTTTDVTIYGDLTIEGDAEIDSPTDVMGDINVESTGSLLIEEAGNVTGVKYTHDNGGYLEIKSALLGGIGQAEFSDICWIDGKALINGHFDCTSNLTITAQASGTNKVTVDGDYANPYLGIVTVSGSSTDIYGEMELDGILNSGDLTVYSGGWIHSGPVGNGAGQSYFYIDATNLDVQSGGLIGNTSSTANSQYHCNNHVGPGSYGGEGVTRGKLTGGSTYGPTKMDYTDNPWLGEAGNDAILKCDGKGGGAVRISVTPDVDSEGDIIINGDIRADGGCIGNYACGSGGTIIIDHHLNFSHTTANFSGSGYITANGGSSTLTGEYPGGGGRISISSILLDYPGASGGTPPDYEFDTSHISANGGTNTTSGYYAAAGTQVFYGYNAGLNQLGDWNNTEGVLRIQQGGNTATGAPIPQTFIPDTGTSDDYEFNLVEASGGANVEYASSPTVEPTACHQLTSSTIAGITGGCKNLPSKPDTLYVAATTLTGASAGSEPSIVNEITVNDLTPLFSLIFRHPGMTSTNHRYIDVQVDDTPDFSSPLWDTTSGSPVDLGSGNEVQDGDRTDYFEYAGSTLTDDTLYYARFAFRDNGGSTTSVWNHRDMGGHYKFTVNDPCTWSAGPGSDLTVLDGQICFIQGAGQTATSVTVQENLGLGGGTLIVGDNDQNTDFTVSGGVSIGGTMQVGWQTSHGYDSTFSTSGAEDTTIQNGGTLTVISNSTAGADNKIILSDDLSVGTITTGGTLNLYDDTSNTIAGNAYVFGTVNVDGPSLAITGTTYLYDSSILTNYDSLQTGYLVFGDSGTTYTGGQLVNRNGATLTVQQTTSIYDDGDLDNEGTINFNGSLLMEDNSTLDSTATGIISLTASSSNSITMNDSAALTNYGSITVPDDITMNNTTVLTNDGSSATISLNNASGTGYLMMNGGTFNNNASASLTMTATNQNLQVHEGATFNNKGTVSTAVLRIGIDGSGNGGTYNNTDGGYTGVTTSTGLNVYRGSINNNPNYTTTSFDIDGPITLRGISGDTGQFNNTGVVDMAGAVYAYGYGELNLNTGTASRWVQGTGNYYNYFRGGTLNVASGATYSNFFTYLGDASTSGYVVNNGTINRIEVDGSDRPAESVYFYTYNSSTITNNSSIDIYRGYLYLQDSTTVTNASTGNISASTTLYNASYLLEDATFNNSGSYSFYLLNIGDTGIDGGTFTNNDTVNGNELYLRRGGTFTNNSDALVTVAKSYIGYASVGPVATFTQEEGTVAGVKYNSTTSIGIQGYGQLISKDEISTPTFTTSGDGMYDGQDGITRNSRLSTDGATIQGDNNGLPDTTNVRVATNSSFTATNAVNINLDGVMEINGTANFTGIGGNNLRVGTSGTTSPGFFKSGNSSDLNFTGSPGLNMGGTGSKVELAGDVSALQLHMQNSTNFGGGVMCLGDLDFSTNACTNSGQTVELSDTGTSLSVDLQSDGTAYLKIANNLTMQGDFDIRSNSLSRYAEVEQASTSTINIQNDGNLYMEDLNSTFTSNGEINIQGSGEGSHGYLYVENEAEMILNYTSAAYDIGSIKMGNNTSSTYPGSYLEIQNGVTVNLNDYHSCVGSGNCVIEAGTYNSAGTTETRIFGSLNIATTTTNPEIRIGSTSGGDSYFILASDNPGEHASLTSASTGNTTIYTKGQMWVYRYDDVDYATVNLGGELHIYGDGAGINQDRGVNVNGTLDCTNTLHIHSGGSMDVGGINSSYFGVVTVNGSETIVDDFMELDGTLNGGNITVNSGGHISSGVGTSTNFLINADSLTVNSGTPAGKISSDAVSTSGEGGQGGGSYGGEGEDRGRSTGGYTYGSVRLGASDTPTYGHQGSGTGGADGHGGGGVRIVVTGDIINNGIISANGADSSGTTGSAGSGGTIILIHDIGHTDTTTVFEGTGSITANGGSDPSGGYCAGGGRIIIDSILYDQPDDSGSAAAYDFTGTVSAYPGTCTSFQAAGGTIVLLGDDNNPRGTLIADNNGVAPSGSEAIPETYIQATGGDSAYSFDRVEARNEADIRFDTAPATDPANCIVNGSGSVNGLGTACSGLKNPDKPETLYINNSYTSAQSGDEPYNGNPVVVGDLTPNFSVNYKDLDDGDPGSDYLLFEVATDSNFSTLKWDATDANNPVLLSSTMYNASGRTEDVIYAGDTLNTTDTFYVRAAFSNSTGATRGLWTHRDMDNHYKFTISNPMTITNSCIGGETTIEDANNPGNNVQNSVGKRFGSGTCTITITSPVADWGVYYSFAPGITDFENTSYQLAPINNSSTCDMDETGNTMVEAYGYNLTNVAAGLSSYIQNTLCNTTGTPFGTTSLSYDKYFNVETSGSKDTIFDSAGGGSVTSQTFDINIYANVDNNTAVATGADPYRLESALAIVPNP